MKRKNEYGQLSREEYDEDTHDYSSEPYPVSVIQYMFFFFCTHIVACAITLSKKQMRKNDYIL